MEILIVGVIVVALMAYASTRIKRSAAAAFGAETIDKADYSVEKPEDFLNVVNGEPKYAFEAYSKYYGEDDAARFRQANAYLTIHESKTIDDVIADIKSSGDEITDDISEVVGSTHYRLIEAKRRKDGVNFRVFYKLAAMDDRVYVFQIVRLAGTADEFTNKTDAFINSFELKWSNDKE
jgi:hypothetical protein